jgi:hypothetical protein
MVLQTESSTPPQRIRETRSVVWFDVDKKIRTMATTITNTVREHRANKASFLRRLSLTFQRMLAERANTIGMY